MILVSFSSILDSVMFVATSVVFMLLFLVSFSSILDSVMFVATSVVLMLLFFVKRSFSSIVDLVVVFYIYIVILTE